MPRLQLESATDSFDLDALMNHPKGVEVLAGVTGLGLPPVDVQWREGAGDGARFRNKRHLSRTIDLPLLVDGEDREGLKELTDRLASMFLGECTLRFVEDDGTSWTTQVHRIGGGDYVYGQDTTGERDAYIVVTLKAGDPFWTSSEVHDKVVTNSGSGVGLLPTLVEMNVASSQVIGQFDLENSGNVEAYPVWEFTGPGSDIEATDAKGQTFSWGGTLAPGEKLTIDARTGEVYDDGGDNRYADMGPAPRLWTIPPGRSKATVTMAGTSTGSFERVGSPRTNYVTNPSLETNLTGYTVFGDAAKDPTITRVNDRAWRGSWSLKAVTKANGYPWTFYTVSGLTIGQTYTARAMVYSTSSSEVAWLSVTGTGVYDSNTGFDRWVAMSVTFTATATSHRLELHSPTSATVPLTTWWDGLYVGDSGEYFDGDSTSSTPTVEYEWSGAAHASTSREWHKEWFGASQIRCSWYPRKALVI